jgi:NAD(P)H dehydrogenase (quinone)
MRKNICIIYYNERCYSSKLAEHIKAGVEAEGVTAISYDVSYISQNIGLLDQADAIIFGSPTYFGSVAAEMKKFMDSTVAVWDNKRWNNKIAAGFTHSSALSGDKLSALMTMFVFAAQHGMLWAGLELRACEKVAGYDLELNQLGSWVGLMAQSPNKGDSPDTNLSDLQTAKYFGARIALMTKKFNFN